LTLKLAGDTVLEAQVRSPGCSLTLERRLLAADRELLAGACTRLEEASRAPAERRVLECACDLGCALGARLPPGLAPALDGLSPGSRLALRAPLNTPWELSRAGQASLLERFAVERPASRPAGDWVAVLDAPRRATLVVDPESRGGWDTTVLRSALAGFEVCQRVGSQSDGRAVRVALGQGSALVVLHARTHPDGTFVLADRPASPTDLLSTLPPTRPSLVVLLLEGAARQPWARLANWADVLVSNGVEAVLGPLWSLPWEGAVRAVVQVLDRMRAGSSLGQAVWLVREASGSSWNCLPWVVHGNGGLTYAELLPRRPGLPQTRRSNLRPALHLVFLEGPVAGRKVPIFPSVLESGYPVTLGGPGAQNNAVELEDEGVPCRALALETSWDGLYLTPSPSLGVAVTMNGLKVSGRQRLEGGEVVQVASTVLRVEFTGEEAPRTGMHHPIDKALPQDGPRYWLEVNRGVSNDVDRRFPLGQNTTLIGRDREGDVVLNESTISRRHCLVVRWEGVHYLRPLTAALTLVNGVPVEGERELHHLDRIQLGECTDVVFLDARKLPPK
ncbi:MAG: FHA domain-containing protein, partial [Candidatus Eremiobacterota bacterium]